MVDGSVGGMPLPDDLSEMPMTATTVTNRAARTRTGGPKDNGPKILEHILGWTFVVVLAMFVTQAGLM